MRKLFTFIISTFIYLQTYSQDEFIFPRSSDIGLNITSVISSFIGNSGAEVDITSYPFVAKLNRGRNSARIGLGFTFNNTNESIRNVEQFIFNNYQLNSRVGWERKKYIGNKFGFFYGLDLVFMLRNEENTVSNTIDITTISTNTTGVGGGPVYGFEYYLNKFMYIGTEGNFYGLYKISSRKENFEFNPDINIERNSYGFDATLTAPVNLYIMVRF